MICNEQVKVLGEDRLEGLGVDSGILAIVDRSLSDRFLAESEPWYDGTKPPFGSQGFRTQDGVLIDAGGADIYPCEVEVCDLHAHTFTVFLAEATSMARWVPLGQLPVPSGLILIGDPGIVVEYAPYTTTSPIDAQGVWTALAMPSKQVDVHVLRELDAENHRNLAVRVIAV